MALIQWKGLEKEDKDKYKEARIAVKGGEGGKRKRSEDEDLQNKNLLDLHLVETDHLATSHDGCLIVNAKGNK